MSSVGSTSSLGPVAAFTAGASSSPTALQGQIQRDQIALNDWTTCVSASTPKGQAAIQALSAQLSADNERLKQTQALQASNSHSTATAAPPSASNHQSSRSIDTWA